MKAFCYLSVYMKTIKLRKSVPDFPLPIHFVLAPVIKLMTKMFFLSLSTGKLYR